MSGESGQNAGRGGWGWLAIVASSTMVYFLSIGPIGALIQHNGTATEVARVVYYPVIWLDDNTPLSVVIEAYCRLWGVH